MKPKVQQQSLFKEIIAVLFWMFGFMSLVIYLFATELRGTVIPNSFLVVCITTAIAVGLLVRSKIMYFATSGYAIFLVVVHFGIWTSRKSFVYDLAKVRAGMSETEVRAIMGKYYEGTGWPAVYGDEAGRGTLVEVGAGGAFEVSSNENGQMQIENSLVFRHDLHEADWGVIQFRSNHVVSVSFLPD